MSLELLYAAIRSGEDISARNNSNMRISINDETQKGGTVFLEAAGLSGSIQPISISQARMPGVSRLVKRGALTVDKTEKFYEEMMEVERIAIEGETEHSTLVEDETNALKANKNQVDASKCLITGKDVFRTHEEVKGGIPPLHPDVKHLAHQFIAHQETREDGTIGWTWDRVVTK